MSHVGGKIAVTVKRIVWLALVVVIFGVGFALGSIRTLEAANRPMIRFDDPPGQVTLSIPSSPCRTNGNETSCQWGLFVNEIPSGKLVAWDFGGTAGTISVHEPANYCGILQADALVGPNAHGFDTLNGYRKEFGYRQTVCTNGCPQLQTWSPSG